MTTHAPSLSARATLASTTVTDLVALAKPRITFVVLLTTLGGMFMAPERPSWRVVVCALTGTALIVAGANALNMFLERDIDGHMARTRQRPLPAGRMAPWVALAFGLLVSAAAFPFLILGTSPVTALLAAAANASYVLAYTPLKQRSWLAVVVGAFPGAAPPLLGWTAVTGRIDAVGLALFGILFFWQIPHFHAIALFRREEYARAGLRVLPNVRGEGVTKAHIVLVTALLVATTYAPLVLGAVSGWYFFAVLLPNAALTASAFAGLRRSANDRWAKRYFALSIPYLVLVFTALLASRR